MGWSCSPLIATNSLNIGDKEDTIRLVNAAYAAPPEQAEQAWAKAESTALLFRKMDDMSWFNNRNAFEDLVRRLAKDERGQPFLTLNDETAEYAEDANGQYGIRFNMCDAAFSIEAGRLNFALYDKARDMGDFAEHLIRYTKADSTVPKCILQSVLAGQLGRIYGVSQKWFTFVFDALRVLIILQGNGYGYDRIRKIVLEINIPKQPYLDWSFSSVRDLVIEAFEASEAVFVGHDSPEEPYRRMTYRGVQNDSLDLHLSLVKIHLGWREEVDVVAEEMLDEGTDMLSVSHLAT